MEQSQVLQPSMDRQLAPALQEIGVPIATPGQTVLFREGQRAGRVLLLNKGAVRLSRASADGQSRSETVGPGHILGLLATICDEAHSKTAETTEDCHFTSVEREKIMALLRREHQFWMHAVAAILEELRAISYQVQPNG